MTTNNDDRLNLKSARNYPISGHSLTICSNLGLFCQNTRVFLKHLKKNSAVYLSGRKMSFLLHLNNFNNACFKRVWESQT